MDRWDERWRREPVKTKNWRRNWGGEEDWGAGSEWEELCESEQEGEEERKQRYEKIKQEQSLDGEKRQMEGDQWEGDNTTIIR